MSIFKRNHSLRRFLPHMHAIRNTKLFDTISMHSFKKKNINSLSLQLVADLRNMHVVIKKVLYLRALSHKALLLSQTVHFRCLIRSISVPFFLLVTKLYKIHSLFSSFSYASSHLLRLYICHVCLFNSYMLPVLCYSRYFSYYRYLFSYLFFFLTSSFFSRLSTGVASLPTNIKKFTVLRSPHSDKKSREQFEVRTHKRVFRFPSCFASFYNYTSFQHSSLFLCTYSHTYYIRKHDAV
jgi:hypothetical protein